MTREGKLLLVKNTWAIIKQYLAKHTVSTN
jgi:hypothetical protein